MLSAADASKKAGVRAAQQLFSPITTTSIMIHQMQPEVVKKYCEALDQFVKIRKFSEKQLRELLEGADIPNKESYIQFVVSACLVNYGQNILPRIKEKDTENQGKTEHELYKLCIRINPSLDLKKVTFPVDESESDGLHVFSTKEASNQKFEDLSRLEKLEEQLSEQIVGQNEAIQKVAQAIRRAGVGMRDPDLPIANFLFVGQTGVGKTELAKVVSETLFDSSSHFVRIDCSEYALPHESAKLTGAPPGYVGYDEGGMLADTLMNNQESVVLFDEIEKANARIHNLLLQILDEGFFTDSQGSKVFFNKSLIILTSNLGVSYVERLKNSMGFDFHANDEINRDELEDETFKAIRDEFPPEFIGRINDIVLFNPLDVDDCVEIVDRVLEEVQDHADNRSLSLDVTRPAKRYLAEEGYSPRYGARRIRDTVIQELENPLCERLVTGDIKQGDDVKVRLRNNTLRFQRN